MTSFQEGGDQTADQGQQGQGTSFGAGAGGDNQQQGDNGAQLSTEAIDALIKRDTHAQDHIKNLEAETAQLRQEMASLKEKADSALTAEQLLERLNTQQHQQPQTVNVDEVVAKATQSIQSNLQQERAEAERKANFSKVADAVQAKYGQNADAEMRQVAAENHMSFEELHSMAHSNPELVLKLCGADKRAPAPSQGSVNTQQYQQEQEPNKLTADVVMSGNTAKQIEVFEQKLNEMLNKQ